MADESIKTLSSSEITEPDIKNPRRNSTGVVKGITARKQQSSPNYLRASTGSCHDICKHGKEHTFEIKARHPILKRVALPAENQNNIGPVAERKKTAIVKLKPSSNSNVRSPEKNIGNVVLAERKKKSAVKLKPSPDSLHAPEIIKREILPPSKKVEVSLKLGSPNNKVHSPAAKSKLAMMDPSSSSAASVGANGASKGSIKTGIITGTSNGKLTRSPKAAVKKVLTAPTASSSPKSSSSTVVNFYARKFSSVKLDSPLKGQNRIRKVVSKKPNNDKVQEKTLHVVEEENETIIMKSVQSDTIVQTSPSPLSQSPKSLSNPVSKLLSFHGDDFQESDYTGCEDVEEFEYTESETDESISEINEIADRNEEVELPKGNQTPIRRKGRAILTDDKDGTLTKSKFRRGKVVDLQVEDNGPKRLRFRGRREVGIEEDNKTHARRRSYKKEVDNVTNGSSPSSEKVVLRHQDVQGKKDAQGLFNNVIEETASKLAESRKSKVKALVGAFETVISLQESKPSSTQTDT